MIQKMNESWSLFRPIVLEERTVSSTSCSSSSSSFATSVAATSLVFVAPSTNNNPTPTMAPTVYNHNHNHHLYQSSESILQRDQLLVLLKREHYYTVPNIPCRNNNNNNNNTNSHRRRPMELEDWRRKICQWGFRVIDHFRLDREVVSVGMNIFDRFLNRFDDGFTTTTCRSHIGGGSCPCPSCKRSLDSRTYQLAAMTSLYLAIKLHTDNTTSSRNSESGFLRRKQQFRLESFVELSRGQFDAEDISEMEEIMLETIEWRVHPPTPMLFVSFMLTTLMPSTRNERLVNNHGRTTSNSYLVLHVVRELSRYLTELSVCLGHEVSCHPPSRIAIAAILASMDLLTLSALPMTTRDVFTQRVIAVCGGSYNAAETLRLQSILQKALWPELLFEDCNTTVSSSTTSTSDGVESRHPIAMAREFGLLDVDRIYNPTIHPAIVSPSPSPQTSPASSSSLPPKSPIKHNDNILSSFGGNRPNGSPVSVSR